MKPVDQTTFGSPHGNCFQAGVASALELPLEEVPHFCDGDNPMWLIDLENWFQSAKTVVANRSRIEQLRDKLKREVRALDEQLAVFGPPELET